MRKYSRFLLLFMAVILLVTACDPLAKLRKSGTPDDKYEAAMKYYEKKRYEQAVYLFEELLGILKGDERRREVYYRYAYCKYYLGELVSAAYYFNDFTLQYPRDEKVEEFRYMHANCYYELSDPYYLDQKYTYKAIEKFQLFIDSYQFSEYVPKANEAMEKLRNRLARKAFEQAKLYYKIGYYKAAVQAFNTMLVGYPDSEYREEAYFLRFKSAVELGNVSVKGKRRDRYEEAMNYYEKFVDKFPSSKFVREAENLYDSAKKNHQKIVDEMASDNS